MSQIDTILTLIAQKHLGLDTLTSSMNCFHVGQSPLGVAVVILVIRSARSCGRILPVLGSTTPPGVLSSHGSASHSSVVAACLRHDQIGLKMN